MLDEVDRRKKGRKKAFIKYHEIEISDERKIQIIDIKAPVIRIIALNLNLIGKIVKIKEENITLMCRNCQKLMTQLDLYVSLHVILLISLFNPTS